MNEQPKTTAEGKGGRLLTEAPGSALVSKVLNALQKLTKECEPHPCGGFTTDDIEWRMGAAFTGEAALNDALDELQESRLIRYAGYDEYDAIGHCYAIAPTVLLRQTQWEDQEHDL